MVVRHEQVGSFKDASSMDDFVENCLDASHKPHPNVPCRLQSTVLSSRRRRVSAHYTSSPCELSNPGKKALLNKYALDRVMSVPVFTYVFARGSVLA